MGSTPKRQSTLILDLAAAAVELGDESRWWGVVAAAVLGPLFHAQVMAVNTLNIAERIGWFSVVHPVDARRLLPIDSPMHHALVHDHPFSERLAQGPVTEPLKVTDLVSSLRWRNLASYEKMRELTGGAQHMTLHFATPGMHFESMSIVRPDPDYSDAEMQLAAQLQPVLQVSLSHLRCRARADHGRASADVQTARNSARALGITDRERTVLELVHAGMSTRAVGRSLGIAPRTVYKHQENLYRKLGVNDRLAAIRVARGRLLLPDELLA